MKTDDKTANATAISDNDDDHRLTVDSHNVAASNNTNESGVHSDLESNDKQTLSTTEESTTTSNSNRSSSSSSNSNSNEHTCYYYGDNDDEAHKSRKRPPALFDPPLYVQRYAYVSDLLAKYKCTSIMDIGCAECKLIRYVKNANESLSFIAGVDIDVELLTNSKRQFADNVFDLVCEREQPLDLCLIGGDITRPNPYFVERFARRLDMITLVEIIEHLYADELSRCTHTVFGMLKPKRVLVTTPNCEFNVVFGDSSPSVEDDHGEQQQQQQASSSLQRAPSLPSMTSTATETRDTASKPSSASKFRHWDHKFEWTRQEFQTWCTSDVLAKYTDYRLVYYDGLGDVPNSYQHSAAPAGDIGHCTQLALFERTDVAADDVEDAEDAELLLRYFEQKKRLCIAMREESINKSLAGKQQQQSDAAEATRSAAKAPYVDAGELSSIQVDMPPYKLVMYLSYPFETFDFEDDEQRNRALMREVNYFVCFLASHGAWDRAQHNYPPDETTASNVESEKESEDVEKAPLSDEERERVENGIELDDTSVYMASVTQLCEFRTIVKFKMTQDEIVGAIRASGRYELTKSGSYIIYRRSEEDDDDDDQDEDERDEGCFDNQTDEAATAEATEDWSYEAEATESEAYQSKSKTDDDLYEQEKREADEYEEWRTKEQEDFWSLTLQHPPTAEAAQDEDWDADNNVDTTRRVTFRVFTADEQFEDCEASEMSESDKESRPWSLGHVEHSASTADAIGSTSATSDTASPTQAAAAAAAAAATATSPYESNYNANRNALISSKFKSKQRKNQREFRKMIYDASKLENGDQFGE